jgi:hypothetical protein
VRALFFLVQPDFFFGDVDELFERRRRAGGPGYARQVVSIAGGKVASSGIGPLDAPVDVNGEKAGPLAVREIPFSLVWGMHSRPLSTLLRWGGASGHGVRPRAGDGG